MEAGRLLASGTPRRIRQELQGGHTLRVRLAGGEELEYVVADEEEQRALLYRLVATEGKPVVEFVEEEGGLEDLFMKITKGIVQ